jgi:ectoine hydroxylase-related dioxygenase (phytanoyl-CoA dioxygenase family)
MSDKGYLSNLLVHDEKDILLKPATSMQECFVGPNSDERLNGKPYWGSTKKASNKRRRIDDSNGTRDHDLATDTTTEASIQRIPSSSTDPINDTQITSPTFSNAIKTFLSSGCCIIRNVLPKDFVSKSKSKVTSDLEFLHSELQSRRREAIESNHEHLIARVARGDFQELVYRDGGRRDVRFQLDRLPFTSPGLVYNPIVYPLVRELLGGGDVNLLYAGVMWAMPQPKPKRVSIDSISQKWHADGGHLFDHHHLPPHCINVFYPLIDLNSENGPTEVMPGTHNLGKLNDTSATQFGLCCDAGSAILFDYRLNHRGGANFSSEPRPVLYLCYAKPFFRDAGNTRSGHSIVKSSPSQHNTSPAWVARILSGDPVGMGEGFEFDIDDENMVSSTCDDDQDTNDTKLESTAVSSSSSSSTTSKKAATITNNNNNMSVGSGERWILFKMNVELPGNENPKVLVVHHGDIPFELSSHFCRENQLGEDFVPVLAESINAQMIASLQGILIV